jgi:probable phosphoglycerate mutase
MKKHIPSALHIYLIRHGETEWALTGQHTGRTDIPLTANGETEARELGRHLRDIRFAHVLTSPLKRARQTCELVGLDKVPQIEPDLVEWDYGDYEGKQSVDIRRERPDWNVFLDGCPHGEMTAQVCERADRLIARLRTLDGTVALFSHGQFGGVLAARWIGLPLVEARHFPLGTASLSIFSFNPHHPEVPVIALWNAASQNIFTKVSPAPTSDVDADEASLEQWENEVGEIMQPHTQKE